MAGKTLLPPGERILSVGVTDDGRLMLCFKYFDAPEPYDGCFPFSYFDPPLKSLDDLEREIVKHFGTDDSFQENPNDSGTIDQLKHILLNEFGSG